MNILTSKYRYRHAWIWHESWEREREREQSVEEASHNGLIEWKCQLGQLGKKWSALLAWTHWPGHRETSIHDDHGVGRQRKLRTHTQTHALKTRWASPFSIMFPLFQRALLPFWSRRTAGWTAEVIVSWLICLRSFLSGFGVLWFRRIVHQRPTKHIYGTRLPCSPKIWY